jgi:hypothetical protein
MMDLIYRPEDEVMAELDKFKSHILGCDTVSDSGHAMAKKLLRAVKMLCNSALDSLSECAGPLRLTPFPLENLLYPTLEGIQKTRHLNLVKCGSLAA